MKFLVLLTIAMTVASVISVKGDWAKKAVADAQKDMKLIGAGDFLPKWANKSGWGLLGAEENINKLNNGS